MHFIKIGESYINLDNVTIIEPKGEGLGYVVNFVGQTHTRSICVADMSDIRKELEKIKILQDLDKVVLKTDEEAKVGKGGEIRKLNAAPNWCECQFQKQVEETGKCCEPIQRTLEDK